MESKKKESLSKAKEAGSRLSIEQIKIAGCMINYTGGGPCC